VKKGHLARRKVFVGAVPRPAKRFSSPGQRAYRTALAWVAVLRRVVCCWLGACVRWEEKTSPSETLQAIFCMKSRCDFYEKERIIFFVFMRLREYFCRVILGQEKFLFF
jgi:hypothetical protein